MIEFIPFPKMARYSRNCVITEKIDGTNACVYIGDDGEIIAGSRTRWITPEQDNYGFAKWVERNRDELLKLGPGQHFGEWWGNGIQRAYGLTEKRFSLFNVTRWGKPETELPACVSLVPVLYEGAFDQHAVEAALGTLEDEGSLAARGFMDPEGIVIYHYAANLCFKKTIKGDASPKSLA